MVSASLPELPFQIDDAARRVPDVDGESGAAPADGDDEKKGVRVRMSDVECTKWSRCGGGWWRGVIQRFILNMWSLFSTAH